MRVVFALGEGGGRREGWGGRRRGRREWMEEGMSVGVGGVEGREGEGVGV